MIYKKERFEKQVKYLRTYDQIFENSEPVKMAGAIYRLLWDVLKKEVSLPSIFNYLDHYLWSGVVEGLDWKVFLNKREFEIWSSNSEKKTKEMYFKGMEDYKYIRGTRQHNFDLFIVSMLETHGTSEDEDRHYQDEDLAGKDIEWYKNEFGKSEKISILMRAFADGDRDPYLFKYFNAQEIWDIAPNDFILLSRIYPHLNDQSKKDLEKMLGVDDDVIGSIGPLNDIGLI